MRGGGVGKLVRDRIPEVIAADGQTGAHLSPGSCASGTSFDAPTSWAEVLGFLRREEWHVSTPHGSMDAWMPLSFSVSKDGW